MANLRGRMARGQKTGAYALGFSDKMKSVAGAVAVLALATTGTVVVQNQFAPEATAAQEAIPSDGEWRAYKTINGNVYVDRDGNMAVKDSSDEALAGVKVYAQWIDYNNRRQKGAVSPIYTTQSKADGTYSIHLPDWTDALGTVHKWEATAGQKLRIWAENPDSSKYQLAFVEGDSVFGGQGDRYRGSWNGTAGIIRVVEFNIAYHDRAEDWLHLPEDKWNERQPEGVKGGGNIKGRLFYDQRGTFGNLNPYNAYEKNYGDVAVPGTKIIGSYVQDEVARRFDQWKAENRGYSLLEFRDAQKQIMADYEAETGKSAIAETSVAEVRTDGSYTLQFKGLWGDTYDTKGSGTTEEKWGTLAPSSSEGHFGLLPADTRKHINQTYSYVTPLLPEGVDATMDGYQAAMFGYPARPVMFNSVTPDFPNRNYVENQDFGLRRTSQGFDVLKYDTSANPAKPGDTAETETFGLIPNTGHIVIWTDSAGKEVHRCDVTSDNLGVIPSCPFTVPEDLAQDEIYTAQVYSAADQTNSLMADSFLAVVTPVYEPSTVKIGEEATVARPKNENGSDVPTSVSFAAATADDLKALAPELKAQLPADIAPQDWVTVNADGTLSLKPGLDVLPGVYNVPVKLTYGSGNDSYDKIINAEITVTGEDATVYEPEYHAGVGKPGEEATIPAPHFTDLKDEEVEMPDGTSFAPGESVPDGVTIDPDTGEISVQIPADANPGDVITVPVEVTYQDGSKEIVEAKVTVTEPDATNADVFQPVYQDTSVAQGQTAKVAIPEDADNKDIPADTKYAANGETPDWVTVAEDGSLTLAPTTDVAPGDYEIPVAVTYPDGSEEVIKAKVIVTEPQAEVYQPAYEAVEGKPGTEVTSKEPTFTDKDGAETTAPEGTTFAPGKDAPEGTTVDPETGVVTYPVPEDAKPGDKVTVPVEVTYPDGTRETVEIEVTVTPTDADSVEPAYEGTTAKAGETATSDKPTFTDKDGAEVTAPEGTKFAPGDGFPPGTKVDPETGVVTYPVPENAVTGEKIDIPVEVIYPDGSIDTTKVIVTVAPSTADEFEPAYEGVDGQPGEEATSKEPTFTDKDGAEVAAPEGTTFAPGAGAPDGVTVDENTGVVTYPVPDDAKPGDKITVPVEVTYPDGSKETVDLEITVGETVEKPDWNDNSGKPGETVEVPNEGGPVTGGETVETEGPGEAHIDENGNITVDINEDAKPGDKVTVIVKDKDGNEIDRIEITVDEPDATDADAFEPAYEGVDGQPGEEATSKEPTFTDKDGAEVAAPEGTTFAPGAGAPDGVTVDENTGVVTYPVPDDAKPGDKITVPVEVTYPDGSKETVDLEITVGDEDQGTTTGSQADDITPTWDNQAVKPGETVNVDNTGEEIPEGSTVELGDGFEPGDWVVTPQNNGTITIQAPAGAKEGDKIEIPVKVTYPDGSVDTETLTVTVVEDPAWDDANTTPGEPIEIPNTGGSVKPGTTVDPVENGSAEIDENGNLIVTPGEDAQPGDEIKVTIRDENGNVIDEVTVTVTEGDKTETTPGTDNGNQADAITPNWDNTEVQKGETVDVVNNGDQLPGDVTNVDAQIPGAPEGWNVTADKDGTIHVTAPEDAKVGDKVTVEVTVEYADGSKDEEKFTVTVTDDTNGGGDNGGEEADKPDWNDNSGKPGETVTVPNEGGEVPEGTTAETDGPADVTIDQNGNVIVDINEGTKPGETFDVVIKDGDGNEIDRIEITVEQPDATDKPDWNDGTAKPGEDTKLPNTGGPVEEGTTTEVKGPGKAEIDENGNLVVTPNPDAKPGDKITVIVKDPEGNEIDRVEITVEDPTTPGGSSNLPDGLIPGLIGGGIIGGIIGGNLPGSSDLGSSGKPGAPGSGDQGGNAGDQAGQGAGEQGSNAGDQSGNAGDQGAAQGGDASQGGAQSGAAGQSGASSTDSSRGGELAMTGVSGVAIMLGAAAMALAIGGALLGLRRRREN